jgi:hypothetical protein
VAGFCHCSAPRKKAGRRIIYRDGRPGNNGALIRDALPQMRAFARICLTPFNLPVARSASADRPGGPSQSTKETGK